MLTGPSSTSVRATIRATASASATSAWIANTRRPVSAISLATASVSGVLAYSLLRLLRLALPPLAQSPGRREIPAGRDLRVWSDAAGSRKRA
jgi:hypothetical protein